MLSKRNLPRLRSLLLRWVLPIVVVTLIIIGRLFFFIYRQPTSNGGTHVWHLMSRKAAPRRGSKALLSLSSSDMEQLERSIGLTRQQQIGSVTPTLLRVVAEPGDTIRLEHDAVSVRWDKGSERLAMPLPEALQQGDYVIVLDLDEYWLLATRDTSPEAIDSRYLGPIHRSLITAIAIW
jgi:Peptidase S26.